MNPPGATGSGPPADRLRQLLAAPGLVVMTALNHDKFGIASPFTYGSVSNGNTASLGPYLVVATSGALALSALWLATRPWARRHIAERRLEVCLGGAVLAILILLTPQGWALTAGLALIASSACVQQNVRLSKKLVVASDLETLLAPLPTRPASPAETSVRSRFPTTTPSSAYPKRPSKRSSVRSSGPQ